MEIWETVAADLNAGNGDIIRFVAVTIPGGEDRGLALVDNLKVYTLLTAIQYTRHFYFQLPRFSLGV